MNRLPVAQRATGSLRCAFNIKQSGEALRHQKITNVKL